MATVFTRWRRRGAIEYHNGVEVISASSPEGVDVPSAPALAVQRVRIALVATSRGRCLTRAHARSTVGCRVRRRASSGTSRGAPNRVP
jgi:hypothetical protein